MNGALRVASKSPTTTATTLFRSLPTQNHPQSHSSLLQSITLSRSLLQGKRLHAHIITSGNPQGNPQRLGILPNLCSMYALCADMASARHVFDEILLKTTFLWSTLVRGYARIGRPGESLRLFREMGLSGNRPDGYTFTFLLKACADLSSRLNVVQVHCRAEIGGFGSDGYVENSLISAYMSCDDMESAGKVFDRKRNRSVVSWNAMISGFVENGCYEDALGVFDEMLDENVEPDRATVVSVLPACASTKDLRRGDAVHRIVDERGYGGFLPARNALLDMYVKCGRMDVARRLFDDEMYEKDVVSWTTMIGGCVLNELDEEALVVSCKMRFSGIMPNSVTAASMLSACSSPAFLKHGKCIHGMSIRLCFVGDIIVETSLVEMYGRVGGGDMKLSSTVFNACSKRTATWNSMISSARRSGLAREAIEHFRLMLMDGVLPNNTTIMSVVPAYSDVADLREAKNVHCYFVKAGFASSVEVATGLVDLYAKIGSLDAARELFDRLPSKDVVTWSAIIGGYGMHGHAHMAIELFDQLVESGIEPNEITFTSVLHSCSHAGLVDEGFNFFKRMARIRSARPGADHYACIVDLLGRAGRLDEARELIKGMPCDPNYAVWGALLGACVIHGNGELGEEAAQRLFELEPENTGNYVLLGNLYASVGRWDDAELVRRMIRERGLIKSPGCSLVDANYFDPVVTLEEPISEVICTS